MSESSRQQVQAWIEKAIENSKKPDLRKQLKQERIKRAAKMEKKFGF